MKKIQLIAEVRAYIASGDTTQTPMTKEKALEEGALNTLVCMIDDECGAYSECRIVDAVRTIIKRKDEVINILEQLK